MRKQRFSEKTLLAIRERLQEFSLWYPFPALIVFFIFFVVTSQMALNLNPRLGQRAEILTFPADAEKEGSIWLSVSIINNEVVLTTDEKKVFTWPAAVESKAEITPFVQYLKKRASRALFDSGLANEAQPTKLKVVFAVDQRLKFLHMRPLLYALAEAQITDYAFETDLTRLQ